MDYHKGNIVNVGVAEWKTTKAPDALRTTLGSCVGVVLYSPSKQAGGLAHILLGEPPLGKIINRGKYARTAIEGLLSDLKKIGIEPQDVNARIFGGSSMFESINSSFLQNIGLDNVKAAKATLENYKIQVIIEDIGGSTGRTITFYMDDGRVLLRANGQERYIYKV